VPDSLTLPIRLPPFIYTLPAICSPLALSGYSPRLPLRAMLMSGARLFVFYLPCLWLGARQGGLPGLAMGAALGNGLAGLVAWLLLRRMLAGSRRPEQKQIARA
jgi:Na+-driven multidrug efflux pump